MKLYFQNESGKRSLIANPINKKEAYSEISKFCKERNFEIYYIRSWKIQENGTPMTCFDVGSHTEFFYLSD